MVAGKCQEQAEQNIKIPILGYLCQRFSVIFVDLISALHFKNEFQYKRLFNNQLCLVLIVLVLIGF